MTTSTTAPTPAAEVFRRLSEDEWRWWVAEMGEQHLWTADEVDDFLPDVSPEAQARRRQYWTDVLERAERIDPADLDERTTVDHAVFLYRLRTLLDQQRHRTFEAPANSDSSFWQDLVERGRVPFADAESARRFLAQLRDVPRYVAQQIGNMRAGLARGFGPARITMTGRDVVVRTVAEETDVGQLTFVRAVAGLPERTVGYDHLVAEAAELTRTVVQPAFRHLLSFLTEEYLPGLPEELAVTRRVGADFYRSQLREFTTLDLSPEEIHEIGLREVAAIRREMEEIATRTGFGGDVDELLAFMRTDPQFYVDRPEQLLREAAWQTKKFDAVVHRYFGRVPRQRFAIVEPAPDVAPFYTFGRGEIGAYVLNTYGLDGRPLYSLPALTLHEAAPGHAFQVPLALEQTQLPDFRRKPYISAYGEGWALYCERLGVEMGMYATDFELMGMLSFQMWRAVRLVADPGIHVLGWSRERAQQYLHDHTAIGWHEVITEIDRYIAWPGQAASYYLGYLKIAELRARAEAALSATFDIRHFHDEVLSMGSVPLEVLDSQIDRFIARGGTSPDACQHEGEQ